MIDIRKKLIDVSDKEYQNFSTKLTPNISLKILGVRVPALKTLAKQIAKGKDVEEMYLAKGLESVIYTEEVTLYGLVISETKLSFEKFIYYLEIFIKKVDNWGTNDVVVSALKQIDKYYIEMWDYMMKSFNNITNNLIEEQMEVYRVRFYLVTFLCYYVKRGKEYIDEILTVIEKIKTNEYYIKMAIAWLLQVIIVKDFEEGYTFLKNYSLDNFIYKKTISKVLESYRITDIQKERIKALRNENVLSSK